MADRSWRDRDRARGGGGRRRGEDRERERAQRSGAYGAYKAKLEKMFGPGGSGLPEALAEKLGPPSETAQAQKTALEALRENPSDAAFAAFMEAGGALPDDVRFLMGLFDGLADEAHLRAVLEKLLALVEGGRRPHRMLLLQRLAALEHRADTPEVRELLTDLRGALE